MIKFKVTNNQSGQRLDRIILSLYSIPYGILQKLFRKNKIQVGNDKKISPSYRCETEDEITIYADISKFENSDSEILDQQLLQKRFNKLKEMIVFENELCLILNKPCGLAVQGGSKIKFCVEDLIKAYKKYDCKLVHRLDKNTSGILVIAKNRNAAQILTTAFKTGKVRKRYTAILDGIPTQKSGTIEAFLRKTKISDEEKIVVCNKLDEGALFSKTNYEIAEQNENSCLVNLYPETGRTHQLRVHCAEVLKCPILGDKKYGGSQDKYMYLHSSKIIIEHLGINVSIDLPEYFKEKTKSMQPVKNQAHLSYLASLNNLHQK